MKNGVKWMRWVAFLWKRLYKKATFVVLLLSIPLLVLAYNATAQEDSGILTIALASRSSDVDTLTRRVWDDLQGSQLILYVECESAELATEMVRRGAADTAWIFEADLENKIYDFAARRNRQNAFVTIVEPEDRVMLKLLREVLSGTLFPHCSPALYLGYLRENAPELEHLSDGQLLEYYENAGFDENLFIITDIEGNPSVQEEKENYLLSPLRGMLAVVVVLAGLASAMYYIRDEEVGTFALVNQRVKPLVELGCQMIGNINVLTVVLISLAVTKQTAAFGRELALMLIYGLCVAAFSMLVRRLTGSVRGLSMVTPMLVVAMLAVCPVFFDLGMMRQVQLLLPPTYFVLGAVNDQYIWYMAGYTLLCWMLCGLLDFLLNGRGRSFLKIA